MKVFIVSVDDYNWPEIIGCYLSNAGAQRKKAEHKRNTGEWSNIKVYEVEP